ncbi:uncharacterized protein LOC114542297 [Dendronephthya gigantea]|uniref:uncharacterized protein LOC114542297 n=1 Tax=Dendronephthya gigantea TaxID=151771 RepID=UPI00106C1675|nr:uncharacterized protein LOC114542297 [Dendronephthya gigantea]
MADDRRINLLQDAFDQIARLTGVSVSENHPMNANSSSSASNSVSMELSRRFPSLRMPNSRPTSASPAASSVNSGNRAAFSRSSSTTSQASRKRKRAVDKPSKVVHKDLVFIPDPEEEQVPTHTARVTLETDGKVVHGFPVDTGWDARSLRKEICKQIPELEYSEFEYVKACYGKLVPLNLANGVEATAEIILKVAGQGAIYLRCTELEDDSILMHSVFDKESGSASAAEDAPIPIAAGPISPATSVVPSPTSASTSVPGPVSSPTTVPDTAITAVLANMSGSGFVPNTPADDGERVETIDLTLIDKSVKDMLIHRTNVMKDLIKEFKDKEILNYNLNLRVIASNGALEKGEGRGVTREILTLFWQSFFISLAVGTKEKIPSIRHDFQKNDWEAVARILIYGYLSTKYFPLNLSMSFVALCILGEEKLSNDLLLDSFKLYVSTDEKEIIDACMNGKFDNKNKDILEFLNSYKCFRLANAENISEIIFQLAHQEIVQRPKYIAACWSTMLKCLTVFDPFKSVEDLRMMYEEKTVSPKKVLKLLSAQPENDAEIKGKL